MEVTYAEQTVPFTEKYPLLIGTELENGQVVQGRPGAFILFSSGFNQQLFNKNLLRDVDKKTNQGSWQASK